MTADGNSARAGNQSAYRDGERPSRDSYEPLSNQHLVKTHLARVSLERMRILPVHAEMHKTYDRALHIQSDTFIEMNDVQGEIFDDARFVFNALVALHDPNRAQKTLEILNYGEGFRGVKHTYSDSTYLAPLNRAIQALDAWAIEVSGDLMIERISWGTGKPAGFFFAPDVAIVDERFHNTNPTN